jgi:hypothetical protein
MRTLKLNVTKDPGSEKKIRRVDKNLCELFAFTARITKLPRVSPRLMTNINEIWYFGSLNDGEGNLILMNICSI